MVRRGSRTSCNEAMAKASLITLGERSVRFEQMTEEYNTGALMILIGYWGPLYYSYKKAPPPQIV